MIVNLLKYRKIQIRSYSENSARYTINRDYFKFWTHEMAYILGFIATDGNIHKNTLKIGLKIEDKYLLEDIAKELSSDASVKERVIHLKRTAKDYLSCELDIYCKEICQDLRNLGIKENKTLKLGRFDFVPQEFEKDFILGVIDGDGSIGRIGGERCNNSIQIRIRLVSASYDFIEYIRDTMYKHGMKNVNITSFPRSKHILYEIGYSTKNSITFYQNFYNGSSIYLKRKYNKLKELIQQRIDYENSKKNPNILKVSAKE